MKLGVTKSREMKNDIYFVVCDVARQCYDVISENI